MINPICNKISKMLGAYIENKLSENERMLVENHFTICPACRKKFYEMAQIMGSLHFEYEKMLNEFDKIEENNKINIKEYESFYENISPYVDDELCYDDCLKFRKYLLKSKNARDELSRIYSLRNGIKKSVNNYMDKTNLNLSRKVIKKLKEENKYVFGNIYKRAAIAIFFMICVMSALLIFIGISYFNHSYANTVNKKMSQNVMFPDDTDWVEFFFDEEGNFLLSAK